MATTEISEIEYTKLKKDLDKGLTNDAAAEKYHYGLRRVRLVRRSKSYASYKALRRNEAKKRAENTPAKPQGGGSELESNDITDLMIEDEPKKPEPQPEPVPEEKPKSKAQLKREQETQAAYIFLGVIALAIVGFIAIIVLLLNIAR